jgi:hypothetical protein
VYAPFGFTVERLLSLGAVDSMKANAFRRAFMHDSYGVPIRDADHLTRKSDGEAAVRYTATRRLGITLAITCIYRLFGRL